MLKNIAIASLIALIGGTAFVITKPALAFQLNSMGASGFLIGLTTSSYFLSRSVGSLIAVKAYKRFKTVSLLFALASLISVLYERSNPLEALALRFLHGLVLGTAWTEIQMLVGLSSRYVATSFSIYFLFGSVSSPLGNFLYSALPDLSFTLSALLFLLASALSLLLVPKGGGGRRGRGKAIIYLLLFILIFRVATSLPNVDVIYVYLMKYFRMSEVEAASAVGMASLIGIPFSLLLSYISDTVGDRPTLAVTILLALVGLLLLTTPYITLGLMILIVSAKIFVPVSRRIAIVEAGKEGIGYLNFVNSLGMVLSGAIYGLALDAGAMEFVLEALALMVLTFGVRALRAGGARNIA